MWTLILASVCLLLSGASNAFEIEPRIVNGFAAKHGQYKFYAFLVMKDAARKVTWCGGSVISNQFVLTAAHCTAPAAKISVNLGTWKARDKYEPGRIGQIVKKENIYIHPKYDSLYLINDISLIKLNEPVTFTELIQPIHLQDTCQSNVNVNVIAVGNGNFSPKYKLAPILQWTQLTTIPFAQCRLRFPFLRHFKNAICAKNTDGRAIRHGDSGGPLIRNGTLIGISSFVPLDSNDIMSPQGFVDLIEYHQWINSITNMTLKIC